MQRVRCQLNGENAVERPKSSFLAEVRPKATGWYVSEQHGESQSARPPANFIVLALMLVWLATGIAALAQTPPAGTPQPKLTLAQAIDLAEKNYPRIRASLEQQVAAQGGVSVARTAYLPRTDILWQTNRATANNVYGLLLPQGVVPSISGPVLAADNT